MNKGLYVDDIRDLPVCYEGWDIARTYEEAIVLLTAHKYDRVSLDHDIASWDDTGREMTGYDIALWLADRKFHGEYVPPHLCVHSANPVGVKNIQGVIDRYLSKDNCEICHGEQGGVRGNENVVDGKLICDYCHSKNL